MSKIIATLEKVNASNETIIDSIIYFVRYDFFASIIHQDEDIQEVASEIFELSELLSTKYPDQADKLLKLHSDIEKDIEDLTTMRDSQKNDNECNLALSLSLSLRKFYYKHMFTRIFAEATNNLELIEKENEKFVKKYIIHMVFSQQIEKDTIDETGKNIIATYNNLLIEESTYLQNKYPEVNDLFLKITKENKKQ